MCTMYNYFLFINTHMYKILEIFACIVYIFILHINTTFFLTIYMHVCVYLYKIIIHHIIHSLSSQ